MYWQERITVEARMTESLHTYKKSHGVVLAKMTRPSQGTPILTQLPTGSSTYGHRMKNSSPRLKISPHMYQGSMPAATMNCFFHTPGNRLLWLSIKFTQGCRCQLHHRSPTIWRIIRMDRVSLYPQLSTSLGPGPFFPN